MFSTAEPGLGVGLVRTADCCLRPALRFDHDTNFYGVCISVRPSTFPVTPLAHPSPTLSLSPFFCNVLDASPTEWAVQAAKDPRQQQYHRRPCTPIQRRFTTAALTKPDGMQLGRKGLRRRARRQPGRRTGSRKYREVVTAFPGRTRHGKPRMIPGTATRTTMVTVPSRMLASITAAVVT